MRGATNRRPSPKPGTVFFAWFKTFKGIPLFFAGGFFGNTEKTAALDCQGDEGVAHNNSYFGDTKSPFPEPGMVVLAGYFHFAIISTIP